jgi:hypothetical protein
MPLYAPGFDFWVEETEAEEMCSIGNAECTARFEKKLLGKTWKCVENCHCCVNDEEHDGCIGTGDYEEATEAFCQSIGDCGAKRNYIGKEGFYYDEDQFSCGGDDCYWEE